MKVGSMFAGIGGFDLGFERAAFDVAWCIEWDKPTADTHRYKQLGNAVTVNVAQWIARRTAEALA